MSKILLLSSDRHSVTWQLEEDNVVKQQGYLSLPINIERCIADAQYGGANSNQTNHIYHTSITASMQSTYKMQIEFAPPYWASVMHLSILMGKER